MKLSLDAMAVLDAIEREGSFAAAAQALCRVPSTITYTIQKLEQDLGVTLFDRSGHRARLTEAGRLLLDEGRRLLDAAAVLEERLQRQNTGWEGELRVSLGETVPFDSLVALIADFDALAAPTRLRFDRDAGGGVWEALEGGRADLALGAPESAQSGHLQQKPLGTLDFAFVVAPGHPLAAASEPIPPAELRRHRTVAIADTSRHPLARGASIPGGQPILSVATLAEKLALIAAGLGCGFVPRKLAAPYIACGRLVEKAVGEPRPPLRLYYAWKETEPGNTLSWFLNRLAESETRTALLC
ncbi:LysR family transcriptional regulator [Crenobacter cavernae]|uniref:LysR family transcriptional regulator n=1 Tax=Crenobacter cavernae TaxID=2290923 RepID=A0A345Y2N3_9NEIS|nr:LysR family transcriptional regulator [Crenobacter cavernae]AXK38185.1 LysR family transcriptional regulator [Crenobacter cavernae]